MVRLGHEMAGIEEKVLDFLALERGMSKSEIQPEDTLAQDLGMDGDDAEYFFRSFAKNFNVDIEVLWLNWKRHFSSEVSFFPSKPRKDPVTVRELVESAVAGHWVKTY